ncbi:MAG: hypothetical protein KF763_06735 [Cyclobacteriaceae bacterium]|nr:hypothetical protein [Cyclobacteriaceae bacterium]
MKNLVVILCMGLSGFAYSQNPSDSLYIVTYTIGTAWDVSKQPTEQPWFKEHSANLSKLRKDGIIKAGARYADKGIIVVTAKSLANAQEIVFADAAVINKLFVADVQKLNVFYEGCLERPK